MGWLEQFLAKVDHVAKEESTALEASPCRAGDDGIRHADTAALCNIDRQSEAALQQATQTASLASRHVLLEVRIAVAQSFARQHIDRLELLYCLDSLLAVGRLAIFRNHYRRVVSSEAKGVAEYVLNLALRLVTQCNRSRIALNDILAVESNRQELML